MSSMQVDNRERGFAYAYDAPLDMRMDPDQELTAARDRQHLGPPPDRARAARVRRGALRGPDRGRDRPPPRPQGARRRPSSSTTRSPPRSPRPRASPAATRPSAPSRRSGSRSTASCTQLDEALPLTWSVDEDRRPRRRAHLPLARGPPRQALLRREGPRLHLPARPARLRVRKHARGGARAPPLDRAHPGRDRGEPPFEVGSPPGRPQAQGGALDMPEHARAVRSTRTAPRLSRAASPALRAARRRPGRAVAARAHRRLRAAQPDPRSPRRRPPPARPRAASWLIGLMLGGIVAMQVSLLRLNSGISRAVQTQEHARAPERGAADLDRRADLGRAVATAARRR